MSPELLDELRGADMIVHAGDICSVSDYHTLCDIAPVKLCLGNNEAKYKYYCNYTADDSYLYTISHDKLYQKLAPHGYYRVHRIYNVKH